MNARSTIEYPQNVKSNRFRRSAVIVRVISRTKWDVTYFVRSSLSHCLFVPLFFPHSSLSSSRLAKADEGEDKVERHSPLVKVAPRSMSPPFRPRTYAQARKLFHKLFKPGELTRHFPARIFPQIFFSRMPHFRPMSHEYPPRARQLEFLTNRA